MLRRGCGTRFDDSVVVVVWLLSLCRSSFVLRRVGRLLRVVGARAMVVVLVLPSGRRLPTGEYDSKESGLAAD